MENLAAALVLSHERIHTGANLVANSLMRGEFLSVSAAARPQVEVPKSATSPSSFDAADPGWLGTVGDQRRHC
jgi:hypothetical protein